MPFKIPLTVEEVNEIDPSLISSDGLIEVIVKFHGDIERVGREVDAQVEILDPEYAILTVHISRLVQLYSFDEVEYIELPKILTYLLQESLNKACINPVQRETGFNLSGRGVIVGIIDSGVDYTHLDFINEDNTSRILFLWDQTIPGNPPAGFKGGTEYTNEQINEAINSPDPYSIVPSRDTAGHGTAVTGIAAGNGRSSNGREKGVAPQASIILVKLGARGNISFARTTEIMRGIKYIIDKATMLNMPVSINLSYGTNDGSHAGDSLFETYIDSMAQVWKNTISVATGNEGSSGHHFGGTVRRGEPVSVEFVNAGGLRRFYMTLWKNFTDTFTFNLRSPGGDTTGEIRPEQRFNTRTLDNVIVTIVYGQPTHYSLEQELYIVFRASSGTIPQGVWTLTVTGVEVVDGRFDIWLPTIEDVSRTTAFLRPSPETTLTLPSTALNVISVGGYNAIIGSNADFSGRGYTRSNVYVKPDIVAPAVGILTTRAGGGYDSFTGTSMAAPFVTGSAALIMEWGIVRDNDPFLYGQRLKAFLQKGASRDAFQTYPNPIWGYGRLCLNNSMELIVDYSQRN
jgi:minor extracellular serine protease Vpr